MSTTSNYFSIESKKIFTKLEKRKAKAKLNINLKEKFKKTFNAKLEVKSKSYTKATVRLMQNYYYYYVCRFLIVFLRNQKKIIKFVLLFYLTYCYFNFSFAFLYLLYF